MRFGIHTLDEFDVAGKTVLCRLDLNQPVDRATGTLKSTARIETSVPTVRELSDKGQSSFCSPIRAAILNTRIFTAPAHTRTSSAACWNATCSGSTMCAGLLRAKKSALSKTEKFCCWTTCAMFPRSRRSSR